jgi:WD40 repeat protein
MVNRAQLDRILEEQALQQQVCIEAECAVKVGRVLGVRRIVTGSVTKVTETLWQVSTTLTNVETAEILRQEVVNHAGDFASLFLSGMASIARKLAATEEELIAGAGRLAPESIAPAVFDRLRGVKAAALAFSYDSARLYYSVAGGVQRWNIQAREQVGAPIEVGRGDITALAVNRTGALLAAGTARGFVALIDTARGEVLHGEDAHSGTVRTLAFSPADNFFASGGEDKAVQVFHARTGDPAYELEGARDEVASLAFSADGTFLVAVSKDLTVRVYDVNLQREVRAFRESANRMLLADLSRDGAYLGLATKMVKIDLRRNRRLDTELVKIRDVKTGEELLSFEAHDKDITGLAFFPDTRYLATGGADRQVKIWDLQANAAIAAMSLASPVRALRVSPNGKWLTAAEEAGGITIWQVTR